RRPGRLGRTAEARRSRLRPPALPDRVLTLPGAVRGPTLRAVHLSRSVGPTPPCLTCLDEGVPLTPTRTFAQVDVFSAAPYRGNPVAVVLDADGLDAEDDGDNGPGWAALRLRSAEQVLGLEPDFSSVPEAKIGVLGAHPEGSEHEYEIRAFAPGAGVPEDPVTGSLNASVAQWLIGAGRAPNSYTLTQGTALGRSGVVSISAEDDEVWVGGATTVCFRGTALV